MTGGRIWYESSFCVKEKGSSEKNKKFQNHLELSYYGSDWNGLAVLSLILFQCLELSLHLRITIRCPPWAFGFCGNGKFCLSVFHE